MSADAKAPEWEQEGDVVPGLGKVLRCEWCGSGLKVLREMDHDEFASLAEEHTPYEVDCPRCDTEALHVAVHDGELVDKGCGSIGGGPFISSEVNRYHHGYRDEYGSIYREHYQFNPDMDNPQLSIEFTRDEVRGSWDTDVHYVCVCNSDVHDLFGSKEQLNTHLEAVYHNEGPEAVGYDSEETEAEDE